MPKNNFAYPVIKAWPQIHKADFRNLKRCYYSQAWWRGEGKISVNLESQIRRYLKIPHALLVNSGTTALESAIRALGIPAESEIIVPALTFFSTASAVIRNQCVPVFADIDPDNYCLDPASLREAITSKTRAVIPVHFAGFPCDMKTITAIAKKHRLHVIEDAAHAFGTLYDHRHVGTFGSAGCFSFQQYKNMTCGEGGCVVTPSHRLYEEIYSLVDCGRKPHHPLHIHFGCGGNYRLSEIQSSLLVSQLDRIDMLIKKKEKAASLLDKVLAQFSCVQALYSKPYPFAYRHSWNFFVLKLAPPKPLSPRRKQHIIDSINHLGLPCYHYPKPVFDNPFFRKFRRWRALPCPQTKRACYNEGVYIDQSFLLSNNLLSSRLIRIFTGIEKLIRG